MKKIFSISLIGLALLFSACEGNADSNTEVEGTETNETTTESSEENLNAIDLGEYDLPGNISIPTDESGKAEISTTDWGSVEIRVGNRYGVELVPFGMSVDEVRAELESDLVYEINFIETTENLLFYEKKIKDSDIDAEYHFFYTTEFDGDILEIKSLGESYSKSAVESMIVSAKSFAAN